LDHCYYMSNHTWIFYIAVKLQFSEIMTNVNKIE